MYCRSSIVSCLLYYKSTELNFAFSTKFVCFTRVQKKKTSTSATQSPDKCGLFRFNGLRKYSPHKLHFYSELNYEHHHSKLNPFHSSHISQSQITFYVAFDHPQLVTKIFFL